MSDRSQALEHVRPGASVPALPFDAMREQAQFIAGTELVPSALQNKPDAIVVVGMLGAELGVPFMAAVSEIHVIEGKASPSAQLRLALVRRAGHEAMFIESTPEKAVIRGRRREHKRDPNAWVVVEWTLEQARKAGLLDEMAEKWEQQGGKWKVTEKLALKRTDSGYVAADGRDLPDWARKQIATGRVKKKENWHRYPAEMLRARAASALCRMHFSDVLAGLGSTEFTAEELGIETDQDLDERLEPAPAAAADPSASDEPDDDDIADADIIDPNAPPANPEFDVDGDGNDPVEMADDFDRLGLTGSFDRLDPEFRRVAWEKWKAAQLPPPPEYRGMTKEQANAAAVLMFKVLEEADEAYASRRRRAFAVMTEAGIPTDKRHEKERHALIKELTGGRTESTGALRPEEVEALVAHCERVKAERDAKAAPDPDPVPEDPPYPFAEDDPGRPFD